MSRVSYVNGRYVPHNEAAVHIEDRGYQFADAVYEGFEIHKGEIVDFDLHVARLKRSLHELQIRLCDFIPALNIIFRQLIRKNRINDGFAYLQISRGVAPRNHVFPHDDVPPSIVATVRAVNLEEKKRLMDQGVGVITLDDQRWARVDIKTVSLLPNVLARQKAADMGAQEAWLVDREGFVTEGAASNAWIINQKGQIQTRPTDGQILSGITRQVVLDAAESLGLEVLEKSFTPAEAENALEAFYTGASSLIMPVIRINDNQVGEGGVGPVVKSLQATFREHTGN